MRTSNILSRAADIIDRVGLTKGAFFSENGVCTLRAVELAVVDIAMQDPFGQPVNVVKLKNKALIELSRFMFGYSAGSIVLWNDSPTTTKEEVVKTLRKAAKAKGKLPYKFSKKKTVHESAGAQ